MDLKARERLVLALDVDDFKKAEELVSELSDYVGAFKIGNQLFTAEGAKVVDMVNKNGGKVFLDLKFHDIPNTVARAAEVATKLGVFIFNVHTSGGYEMMKAAAVTGADMDAKLNDKSVPLWQSFFVPANSILKFGSLKEGCRTYICVAGGIQVPPVMGSRSTYLRGSVGGFKGRKLAKGNLLPILESSALLNNK